MIIDERRFLSYLLARFSLLITFVVGAFLTPKSRWVLAVMNRTFAMNKSEDKEEEKKLDFVVGVMASIQLLLFNKPFSARLERS